MFTLMRKLIKKPPPLCLPSTALKYSLAKGLPPVATLANFFIPFTSLDCSNTIHEG